MGMKTLIVDDEFNVRYVIRQLGQWESNGITELLEARNGVEAKISYRRRNQRLFLLMSKCLV